MICFSLFLAGFIVGRVLPAAGRPSAPTPTTAAADVLPAPVAEPLIPAGQSDPVGPPEIPVSVRDHLAMLSRLNAQLQRKVQVPLVTIEQLNPDFVVWFGLSDAEVRQLEEAIASAREGVRALEAQHVVMEPSVDDTINLRISPFPEQGAEIFDRFQAQVAQTIGPERYHYYRELSDYEGLSNFGGFGLQTVQIHVSDQPDKNGQPRWTMTSRYNRETETSERIEYLPRQGLKRNYPLIYQRLVAQGLLVED
jgi:hypothetical protein